MSISNHDPHDRRRWLQRVAGGAAAGVAATQGLFGLNWMGLLRAQAAAHAADVTGPLEPIRSCILVFQYGGPSHIDTFDMKPAASAETRGEFRPISTSVPGMAVCEHLPNMSRVMHKVAQVRSMSHTNRLHDSAATEVLTGYPAPNGDVENFAPFPQFYPSYGSTLSYLRHDRQFEVPYAALPWVFHNVVDVPCQGGGFLGSRFDPFQVAGVPEHTTYNAAMLDRPDNLTFARIARRLDLMDGFERGRSTAQMADTVAEWRRLHTRAVDLLSAELFRDALDIELEDRPKHAGSESALGPTTGRGGRAICERLRLQTTGSELGRAQRQLRATQELSPAGGRPRHRRARGRP
jgi:hypothetical protein